MASTIFDAEMGLVGAEDALAALGLTAEELKGLSPETQFQIIADKLGAVDDASTKAAIAQDIFGRSGAELIPLMNEGAEGMAALRQEARDLGVVFSQDAANSRRRLQGRSERVEERRQRRLLCRRIGADTGHNSLHSIPRRKPARHQERHWHSVRRRHELHRHR